MLDKIETLDRKGLRKFGLTTGAIVAGLFGLVIPLLFTHHIVLWPWYIAAVLSGVAILLPNALNPVYMVWMRFGQVLGWINTRIILGVLFYVIFTPVAIILKLLGKDPMQRKIVQEKQSYRVISNNQSKEHMERPF